MNDDQSRSDRTVGCMMLGLVFWLGVMVGGALW